MVDERLYRVILGVLLVGATAVLVPFRVRAARGSEKISHRDEGLVFAAALRLTGLVFWLAVSAFLIRPQWIAAAAIPLPAVVRYSGIAFLLVGTAIVQRALTHLGRNLTDTVVVRQGATLVTSGPYRY